MKRILQKLILLLVCLFAFTVCGLQANAEEKQKNEDHTEVIHAKFYTLTTEKNSSMEVRYDPDWFRESAQVYQHDLAKLSLGLATSAFRPNSKHAEGITAADMNLSDFLTEAHFTDLRSDDYDKDPNMYTVSTVMGHQQIGTGDDGFELIAVGLCGQGYLDEWESNFSIGSGDIHDGFSRSSQLVYDRIFGYIASLHLQGPYKIWLSGFSRAAAISNITAARLDDSSMFSPDTVYCYTFATPRTIRKNRKGSYSNIFNIVGKDDPVPCIPFADWGYERYGIDMLTPALETDSDFVTKRIKADKVYKDITGIDYWSNHDADAMSRTLLSYLLKICPSVDIYTNSLQEKLITLWEDRSFFSVMSNLLEIANDPLLINEETREEANGLLDYLSLVLLDAADASNMFSRWNDSASMGANVLQAHTPELYISWVFSVDDGRDLYTKSDTYRKVYISTGQPVTMLKGNEIIETLRPEEEETFDKSAHSYLSFTDDKVTALIPGDKEYSLYIEPDEFDLVNFFTLDYRIGRQSADHTTMYGFDIPEGGGLAVTFTKDGNVYYSSEKAITEDMLSIYEAHLDISSTILFIRSRAADLSWRQLTVIFLFIPLLLIALFMFVMTFIVGRIRFSFKVRKGWFPKGTKYRAFPYLCACAVFMLFANMQLYRELFPDSIDGIVTYKRYIAFMLIAMAAYGLYKQKSKLTVMILAGVILLCGADIITSSSLIKGPILFITAYLVLCTGYFMEERPSIRQILLWIVLSLAGIFILSGISYPNMVLRVIAIVYLVVGLLMVCLSINMHGRTFAGTVLLFAAGVLLMRNQVDGTTFLRHMLSLGTYYLAVLAIAGTGTQTRLPRLVPESEKEEE
ncbi:MAG: hypothetical protein K6G61_01735 [Solobacterium sp.]|nr:hypothetical protein [Solobacterium sp.]